MSVSRRSMLKIAAASTASLAVASSAQARKTSGANANETTVDDWAILHDRIFLGGAFWANPMENWAVKNGWAECQSNGGDRNIQLITHQLESPRKPFEMSVELGKVDPKHNQDGGAGFRIGIKSDLNEYRSNSFARSGIRMGVDANGLRLGPKQLKLDQEIDRSHLKLHLTGTPGDDDRVELELTLLSASGEQLGSLKHTVVSGALRGNVALANNLEPNFRLQNGTRYRFRNWNVSGKAFTVRPERAFGPILWTMYTLSDSCSEKGFIMKLSALTGPLGEKDSQTVELQLKTEEEWKSQATATLDPDAWVATFTVPNWDESQAVEYRVVYAEQRTNGTEHASEWSGTIKANPSGRPLKLGALTCQNDYGFPYEPVANNVTALDPDMLYFSGDQIYENHGGFGLIREPAGPAILNYLRKYYQFGWSFREAMKDRPTVVIPDDHDVFQGNIWGNGGTAMPKGKDGGASSSTGYREPARMVNAVHRTCASHHPDPFDPTPVKQGISVYYGTVVYGDVSFAILGDRQWKNGPEEVATWEGRADHVRDTEFDVRLIDKPGLELLGQRQEHFLQEWAKQTKGHRMKVLLSQTVFAGLATHHGSYDGFLRADLDSGGWPQTPRDRAIDIIRETECLHINGDQHLTSLVQYGVKEQRDSNWSFCTPAIAAGYPRWWRPDEMGMSHKNRPKHQVEHTGEYVDGLDNKVYVYAIGNPVVPDAKNRYEKAHQKGSGFGFVTVDTEAQTFYIESFRFLIDALEADPEHKNQFPGWPVLLHAEENAGKNRLM